MNNLYNKCSVTYVCASRIHGRAVTRDLKNHKTRHIGTHLLVQFAASTIAIICTGFSVFLFIQKEMDNLYKLLPLKAVMSTLDELPKTPHLPSSEQEGVSTPLITKAPPRASLNFPSERGRSNVMQCNGLAPIIPW